LAISPANKTTYFPPDNARPRSTCTCAFLTITSVAQIPFAIDFSSTIAKAGMNIVRGASLDNNIVCVVEKEAIVVDSIANDVKKAMCDNGAVELNKHQARRLSSIILDGDHTNKKFVGQNVQVILKEIGMTVDETARLAFVETDPDHPFAVTELLMPVIPFIRVKNVDDAIDVAVQLEGGRCHTAVMHSRNIDNLHNMAVKINTSIFVKNAPAYAGLGLGGEGPTSFTIASPTGEGMTSAKHFTRRRRCTLAGHFRIT